MASFASAAFFVYAKKLICIIYIMNRIKNALSQLWHLRHKHGEA